MPKFKFQGIELFFEEYGEGTPIVFIHPPAMGRKVFFFQKHLGRFFHVIFPDLSGHGDSDISPRAVTIKGYADEIKMLMEHLQVEEAFLCGYSSGAIIAQEFALNYPNATLGLILVGGFPEVRSQSLKYEHILGMYFVKHHPKFLAKIIANSHSDDPYIQKTLFAHMVKADRRTWFQFYEQSLNYSCVDRLKDLNLPLLLLYGSQDFINQHIRIYQRYTTFEMEIFKKVSHQLPTKRWEQLNRAVEEFVLSKV